jgi:hypothetical protein
MDDFDALLAASTQAISQLYFQLPVAGHEAVSYRERVYCYELYHQLRCRWPMDTAYSLAGEIDKKGHPLVRGNGLDNVKPDFLIHIPGDMGGNFAAMEVKSVNGDAAGLGKDLRTLTAFTVHANYERSLLLVYGAGLTANTLLEKIYAIAGAESDLVDMRLVEVWRHAVAGEPAFRIA